MLLFDVIGGGLWLVTRETMMANMMYDLIYTDDLNSVAPLMMLTLGISFYCWLLFRCAVILPHLALGRGGGQMRQGWYATRHLTRSIGAVALIAGLFQALLMWVQSEGLYLLMRDDDGYLPLSYDYFAAAIYGVFYSIIPLLGAAILTVIYTKIDVKSLD